MEYQLKDVLLISKNEKVHQWEKIEKKVGFIFPEDYKKFIDLYGEGGVNEFLWILSPFSENENLNLINCAAEIRDAYIYMKNENPDDFSLDFYDGNSGIFPWGVTDNGDELYWNICEEKTEIVVYASRYEEMEVFEMTMVEFIYKLLTEEVECSIFPDDFLIDDNFYEA